MTNPATEINVDDILRTRIWFYDFLGKSLYMEPEKKRLEEISKLKVFEQLLDEESAEDQGVFLLKKFFDNVSSMDDEELKGLRDEYSRLFIGPGHLPAPPWGSVYLSKERIIFDENTLEVREFFRKWGVVRKTKNKEPDDHIGYELEFLSILIDKGLKELEKNNMEGFRRTLEAQKEFLERHALTWIHKFSNDLYTNTESYFYKGLAVFLPEYLKMDLELLDDLLANLEEMN